MGAFPPNDDCPVLGGGEERSQEQKERDAILVVRGMAPPLQSPPQSTNGSKKIDPETFCKPQPHTKTTSSRFFVGPRQQRPTSNK